MILFAVYLFHQFRLPIRNINVVLCSQPKSPNYYQLKLSNQERIHGLYIQAKAGGKIRFPFISSVLSIFLHFIEDIATLRIALDLDLFFRVNNKKCPKNVG